MLLDTNIISFYFSDNLKYRTISEAIFSEIGNRRLHTCPVVEAEVLNWAHVRKFKEEQKATLQQFISDMTYLNVTSATAKLYADPVWLTVETMSNNDKWLASLARQHNLVILTCDSDFIRYDFLAEHVIYLNPKDYF